MSHDPTGRNENHAAHDYDLPILRGRKVRKDHHDRIRLNDIWEAAGSPANMSPKDWKRLPTSLGLVQAIYAKEGKSHHSPDRPLVSKPGLGGGTFGEARLALAYAEYISPDLALEVKDVFLRYLAADANLADDVLERASPAANEWAGIRALSRAQRRKYTDCLQAHGVKEGRDYAACSDTLYLSLFDKRAAGLKASKGLSKSASLRDNLTTDELAFVVAGETLARERIDETDADGGEACRLATLMSARNLRRGIDLDRADRQGRNPPPANENDPNGRAA